MPLSDVHPGHVTGGVARPGDWGRNEHISSHAHPGHVTGGVARPGNWGRNEHSGKTNNWREQAVDIESRRFDLRPHEGDVKWQTRERGDDYHIGNENGEPQFYRGANYADERDRRLGEPTVNNESRRTSGELSKRSSYSDGDARHVLTSRGSVSSCLPLVLCAVYSYSFPQ